MVGGTDNSQLKAAAEEMVAVMAKATATERVMMTATRGRQQWCINDSNDNNATGKCLWQWLRQLWMQRWWQWQWQWWQQRQQQQQLSGDQQRLQKGEEEEKQHATQQQTNNNKKVATVK
jgi:hypothetical protein